MKFTSKLSLLLLPLLFSQLLDAQVKEDGVFYLKEEQYERAAQELKVEINQTPLDAQKKFYLGEAYFLLGKFEDAKNFYQAALSDLKSPFGYIGLGKSSLQAGNKNEAIEFFNKAIKINKKNTTIHAAIASACMSISTPDTATANVYLKQGLAISGKNAQIQMALGDLNLYTKNFGLAANDYERAIFYDKSNYEAFRKLGVMFTMGKNYNDARRNFEESLRLAPNQILGYKYYSDLYYAFAKYTEAEKYFKTYASKVTLSISEIERYAFILFFNKNYKEASVLLDKVIAEKGAQTPAAIYRVKAYVAYETNDIQVGLDAMNTLIRLKKSEELLPSDYGYNARLLAAIGQDSLAIENFRLAVVKTETPLDYLDEFGKLYVKQKNYVEASKVYTQIINLGGDASLGNFNMGKLYYQAGDEQRAIFSELTSLPIAKGKVNPKQIEIDATQAKMFVYYNQADSCFAIVNTLSPTYATGFMWRGRIQSILDPESKSVKGKEFYEKTISILDAAVDKSKLKKAYIESYNYLGSYYYFAFERSKGADATANKELSISYFKKILDIEPNDAEAKDKVEKLSKTK